MAGPFWGQKVTGRGHWGGKLKFFWRICSRKMYQFTQNQYQDDSHSMLRLIQCGQRKRVFFRTFSRSPGNIVPVATPCASCRRSWHTCADTPLYWCAVCLKWHLQIAARRDGCVPRIVSVYGPIAYLFPSVFYQHFVVYRRRALAAAGPQVWNSLPPNLRLCGLSYGQFRLLLKTFLFRQWVNISAARCYA